MSYHERDDFLLIKYNLKLQFSMACIFLCKNHSESSATAVHG